MNDQLLSTLEEIYAIESTSFIRYLISNAEVQVRHDFDRKVRSFFVDWYRASDLNHTAFIDLLNEYGHVPPPYGYPLRFSEYNYLHTAYLLGPVIRLMGSTLEQVAARMDRLAAWPRANELVKAVLEREAPFLERARHLEEERPQEEQAPAKIKGTSASRR